MFAFADGKNEVNTTTVSFRLPNSQLQLFEQNLCERSEDPIRSIPCLPPEHFWFFRDVPLGVTRQKKFS